MKASCVRSRASASLWVKRSAKLYVALPYCSTALSKKATCSGVVGSNGLRGAATLVRAGPEDASDRPEGRRHDCGDEKEEHRLEQHDPGRLAAAAERDDPRDERKPKALERIARQTGNRARLSDRRFGIPAGRLHDVGDSSLRRDDEETVVVNVVRRAYAHRVDAELIEHALHVRSFSGHQRPNVGTRAVLRRVTAQHGGRIVRWIERDFGQGEAIGIEPLLHVRKLAANRRTERAVRATRENE